VTDLNADGCGVQKSCGELAPGGRNPVQPTYASYVPWLSVCSNTHCDFHVLSREKQLMKPPDVCPTCQATVVVSCPQCGAPLWGNPGQRNPMCAVCRVDVHRAYLHKLAKLPSVFN
jgi:hypothetical protein